MSDRTIYLGSIEYVNVELTSDVNLTGTVEFSLDNRATWTAATWLGSAATTRTAQLLVDTNATAGDPPVPVWEKNERVTVYVRLTDAPEVPIINAGDFLVV